MANSGVQAPSEACMMCALGVSLLLFMVHWQVMNCSLIGLLPLAALT